MIKKQTDGQISWQNLIKKPSVSWTLGGFLLIVTAVLLSGSALMPGITTLWQGSAPPLSNVAEQSEVPVDRLVIGGTDSGEIRKIVWGGAVAVWKRYPLLGSGPETFAYSYYLDRPVAHNLVSEWDFLYNKAHNEFLNFLATTGVVGLGAYSILLIGGCVLFFGGFKKHLRQKPASALVFAALFAGSAGLAVSNFFGFSTVMVTVLQFLFWACAVILMRPTTTPTPQSNNQKYSWLQYVLFTLIGISAVGLTIQLMRYYRADLSYAASKKYYQAGDVNTSVALINEAISLNPREALYWDQMAQQLAQVASSAVDEDQQNRLTEAAVQAATMSLQLNPEQRNFYKTQARIFILLGQVNPQFYGQAIASLTAGTQRAPTDAKLLYNRGLLYLETGNSEAARADFMRAIVLKPNYEPALVQLATLAAQDGDFAQAITWTEQIRAYNPLNASVEAMVASYSAEQIW